MTMSKSEAGKLGSIKSKPFIEQKRLERIEEYNKNKKTCIFCNCVLEYKDRSKKFCNSSCAAKHNNKDRKKHNTCISCENEISSKNKFCSISCQHNMNRKKAVLNNEASSRTSKSYLIKLHGAKCMECGWDKINPYTNKVPIELEHIDGNSENNELSNLKLLCPNCHSLTPTYKALNKGNGRHKRMERYKEGKSF